MGTVYPETPIKWPANKPQNEYFNFNGDIAFDKEGNLHIMSGHLLGADLWTLQASEISRMAMSGGQSEASASVVQVRGVNANNTNGIAFKSDGQILLSKMNGNISYHYRFNPTDKTLVPTRSLSHNSWWDAHADLGSCATPPTLTVEKRVNGSRYEDEQFRLTVHKWTGSQENGSWVPYTEPHITQGQQDEVLGGSVTAPVIADSYYRVAETLEGSASLVSQLRDNQVYGTSLECKDQFGQNIHIYDSAAGGTVGGINIPSQVIDPKTHASDSADLTCTFTNTPRYGSVSWMKKDNYGDFLAGTVWNITGPNGTNLEVSDCVADTATQCTGPDVDPGLGKFKVEGLKFGAYTYQIDEASAPEGYIIPADHNRRDFTVNATNPDKVFSEAFVNQQRSGSVYWEKEDDSGNVLAGTEWTLTSRSGVVLNVTDCIADNATLCADADIDPRPGKFKVTLSEFGKWVLEEVKTPEGYEIPGDHNRREFKINGGHLNYHFTPAFKNKQTFGSVAWQKVDDSTPTAQQLAGSQWSITNVENGKKYTVVDQTPDNHGQLDADNQAGQLKVEKLPFGKYKLKETVAPAGYQILDREYAFEIKTGSTDVTLDPIVNTKRIAPTLPLTGGLSRDFYTLTGIGVFIAGIAGATSLRLRARRRS